MTYQTRDDLLARLTQYEKDIKKMNDVANAAARVHGYCDQWEGIILNINQKTFGRLGLKGRPGHLDTTYVPPEGTPLPLSIAGCNCEQCEQARLAGR